MTTKPLSDEAKLMLGRMKRQLRGEDIPVISGRQYRRLRNWCKVHMAEILTTAMFALLFVAGAYPLAYVVFAAASAPVLILWRCYQLDKARVRNRGKQDLP